MINLGWGGLSNGHIAPTQLMSIGGHLFQAQAGAGFVRMAADYHAAGHGTLSITEAYRDYDEQVRLFKARYTAGWSSGVWWNGQFWRKKAGAAVAAVPGTSNHGWGRAVDVGGYGGSSSTAAHQWIRDHCAAYGYSWATGRASGEPWHLEFVGAITSTAGGSGTPIEEDFLSELSDQEQRQLYNDMRGLALGAYIPNAGYTYDAHFLNLLTEIRDALLKPNSYTGQFRPMDVLVSQVPAILTRVSALNPTAIDIPALAAQLKPLLAGGDVDENLLTTKLLAALAPQFAKLNANIDDQPTTFIVSPQKK
jgi:hypothetical protein